MNRHPFPLDSGMGKRVILKSGIVIRASGSSNLKDSNCGFQDPVGQGHSVLKKGGIYEDRLSTATSGTL